MIYYFKSINKEIFKVPYNYLLMDKIVDDEKYFKKKTKINYFYKPISKMF